jgi:hypothetical protein
MRILSEAINMLFERWQLMYFLYPESALLFTVQCYGNHFLSIFNFNSFFYFFILRICYFSLHLPGSKVENKQLLVDKFIPKVTSAVMTTPPGAPPDNDTIKAPLV